MILKVEYIRGAEPEKPGVVYPKIGETFIVSSFCLSGALDFQYIITLNGRQARYNIERFRIMRPLPVNHVGLDQGFYLEVA